MKWGQTASNLLRGLKPENIMKSGVDWHLQLIYSGLMESLAGFHCQFKVVATKSCQFTHTFSCRLGKPPS